MDEEIDAHHRNKTWKLVPRPVEVPVIDYNWIYRIKTKGARNAVQFKSRLVVRFRQREGVDYSDTFLPVPRYYSARLLLAAIKNFDLQQCRLRFSPVTSTRRYTWSSLRTMSTENPEYVCQLQRSMYGLKQGFQFNKKIRSTLEDIGLIPTHSDRYVFTSRVEGDIVYIVL